MKPPIFFFFFLILIVPISYAYDCTRFTGTNYDNCVALNSTNENLIANLIYTNTTYPDHDFVSLYNQQIVVTSPPNDAVLNNSGVIRNAWVSILTIDPSIVYENNTYVPKITNFRAESGYNIILPTNYYNGNQVKGATCQIIYSDNGDKSNINWIIDGASYGVGKNIQIILDTYNIVHAQANIQAVTKADNYVWNKYCCSNYNGVCQKYCYACKFSSSTYKTDTLTVDDSVNVQNYNHNLTVKFTITGNYTNTFKGFLKDDNQTNIFLNFNNSYYNDQDFVYYANFSKQPYDFIYLKAEKVDSKSSRNLIITNNSFYVNDASNCSIESMDFFNTQTQECAVNITNETLQKTAPSPINFDLGLLLKLAVFIFILWLIYKAIKKYWGKILIPIVCLLLLVPSVLADDCGITNLASCIPQALFNAFISLLNSPLEPLLNLVNTLMTSAPDISLFQGVWAIVIYCLSLFYGLLFVYSGFQFLFSGHDAIRREMAKEWLKNTVIMIVFIQASFYLYGLFVNIGSLMTSAVISLIDQHFFMITADNIVNVGLEFLFLILYVIILLITVIFLVIRYLIVAFGVLFAPIGIFCYFIPPLRSYGRLILNILGMCIFITFLDAIIILACSMLIAIPLFQNLKILVMINCFGIIDLLFIFLAIHIIHKTSIGNGASNIVQAVKYIGMIA